MNRIVLSYGELILLALGIGISWVIVFYLTLVALEKMGFLIRR